MSTLFCGVFVKAASLCFAADAYNLEHRTLLALDLICARRCENRLVPASAASPIARVPVEVWSLVKQQLVDQAIALAEHSAFDDYSCACWSPRPERWTWDSGKRWIQESEMFWSVGGLERSELDALGALGLPLRSTTDAANCSSFPGGLPFDRSHSVAQISLSALPLPPERAPRLIRFLEFFNLVIENPSSSTLYASSRRPLSTHAALADPSTTTTDTNSKELQARVDHKRVCCSNPRTAPHWWLVTTTTDS
ncbi:hypothetical protein JCM11491_001106 [Sporobolomyces phaffii]